MDPFEGVKQALFQECDELVTDAEQGRLAMEAGDADSEAINAVFRSVHSINWQPSKLTSNGASGG